MNTYNWDCKTVDVHPSEGEQTNVVYNVHWRVTATSDAVDANDNAFSATSIGTQSLEFNSDGDFIAFDELSHANIIDWVKAAMGEEQVTSLESGLDSQISELQTPTSITMVIEDEAVEDEAVEEEAEEGEAEEGE